MNKWTCLNLSWQAVLALEPGLFFTVRIIALFIFTLVFSLFTLLDYVLCFLSQVGLHYHLCGKRN